MLLFGKDRTSTQRKNDIFGLLIMLGIAGILVGIYFLYINISRKYADKKDDEISKLPRSALPILVLNNHPVVDFDSIEMVEAEQRKRAEESMMKETEDNIKHTTAFSNEKPVQLERNSTQTDKTTANFNSSHSAADEIEKFKRLLDKGIITQEEFDAKKKQLLGM